VVYHLNLEPSRSNPHVKRQHAQAGRRHTSDRIGGCYAAGADGKECGVVSSSGKTRHIRHRGYDANRPPKSKAKAGEGQQQAQVEWWITLLWLIWASLAEMFNSIEAPCDIQLNLPAGMVIDDATDSPNKLYDHNQAGSIS
jgi:hypothetical protein